MDQRLSFNFEMEAIQLFPDRFFGLNLFHLGILQFFTSRQSHFQLVNGPDFLEKPPNSLVLRRRTTTARGCSSRGGSASGSYSAIRAIYFAAVLLVVVMVLRMMVIAFPWRGRRSIWLLVMVSDGATSAGAAVPFRMASLMSTSAIGAG